MYSHVFKILNNVPSHLIVWGNPFDCNGKDIIVCVSGNPGIADFYIEFGSVLHNKTGLPVCVIGQAGHELIPNHQPCELKNQEHLFNLEGQLAHKLDLINNYIDKRSNLHLMGHSIGSWMLIELLDKHSHLMNRVSTVNLLFPTVQRMAESPSGKYLTGIIKRIHHLLILLVTVLSKLPHSVLTFFVSLYLKYNSISESYSERILKILNPHVVQKSLFLGYDEMNTVTKLNKKGIERIKSVTNVIGSTRDGWAPLHYMEDFKQFQPHLEMKIVNIAHAFVLKSSERVAEMVGDFVNERVVG